MSTSDKIYVNAMELVKAIAIRRRMIDEQEEIIWSAQIKKAKVMPKVEIIRRELGPMRMEVDEVQNELNGAYNEFNKIPYGETSVDEFCFTTRNNETVTVEEAKAVLKKKNAELEKMEDSLKQTERMLEEAKLKVKTAKVFLKRLEEKKEELEHKLLSTLKLFANAYNSGKDVEAEGLKCADSIFVYT